jgi:hypothetical protein
MLPNAMTTPVDPHLRELLADHRDRFDYLYEGWLSDHGPMALLALAGLGVQQNHIETFATAYQARLDPLPATAQSINRTNYAANVGNAKAYPALVQFFDQEIQTAGWRVTVAEYLPDLISGWVKDALHATIRLAYGIEFEVASEVAAGLAYLTVVGPDPALAAAAAAAPTKPHADPLLIQRAIGTIDDGVFNARYAQAVASPAFRNHLHVPVDAGRTLPREALGVFDATHDFFALHLVTGSHAWRIISPHLADAVPNANALLASGLFAAYLALDQPAWQPPSDDGQRLDSLNLSSARDEHDVKLAYSCLAQSRAFDDRLFESVACRYLAPRIRAP